MSDSDPFDMQDVASQNLAQVGFNPDTKQGRVIFLSGGDYIYEGCSQAEADSIISAASPNAAFTALWRGRKRYQRVG